MLVDYRATDLQGADAVTLPTFLLWRLPALWRHRADSHRVMAAVKARADHRGCHRDLPAASVCEAQSPSRGEAGAQAHSSASRRAAVDIRIERTDTVCTSDYAAGDVIRIPIAHGEGRYVADPATLDALERDHRVMLRYVPVDGTDVAYNPNGSMNDIAGICNDTGTVVGFMPHPERLAELSLGSDAGQRFFTSLMNQIPAGIAG